MKPRYIRYPQPLIDWFVLLVWTMGVLLVIAMVVAAVSW